MARISQRRYAQRVGVSHVYINRLVREGKLPADSDGRVDPDEADRVLAAFREPARSSRRTARDTGVRVPEANPRPQRAAESSPLSSSASSVGGDLPTLLLKTRIKSEAERGKLLELKAKVEAGRYVDADEVKVAAFNKGRIVRDNLLNVAGRLAAVVAAESDERRCFELIDGEIRQAIVALTGAEVDE